MTLLERTRQLTHPGASGSARGWNLRLYAVCAGLGAALASLLLVALPILLVWAASAASTVSLGTALGIGADGWLLAHFVHLSVGPTTISLTPWLLAALPLVTLVAAGRRLLSKVTGAAPARGVPPHLVESVLWFVAVYVAAAIALALALGHGAVHPSLPGTVTGALVFAVAGLGLAAWREGVDLRALVAPATARLPSCLRTAVRPAMWGAGTLAGAGLLLVVVVVVLHLGRIGRLYGALDAGIAGGLVLTLGQLAALPNLALWAVGWLAGPGFGIADGTSVTWTHSQPGLLPLVPALGALPDPGPMPGAMWLAGLVPVAVGALVGWRSLRAVAQLSPWQVKAKVAGTACALAAVLLGVAAALAGGAMGGDRLSHVGPDAVLVALALAGELALGAALVVGLGHRRASRR